MFNPIPVIEAVVNKFKGTKEFGYGTLNEMNASNRNFPLIWIVLPVTVTDNAFDNDGARVETWPIVMRVVTSGKVSDEMAEKTKSLDLMKVIADGICYTLMDDVDQNTTLGPITKQQLWLQQDDAHIGWEYRFNFITSPDVDYCCQPFNA